MNSEAARYFVTVASCGSFSAAAKKLDVSHQGLNKAISSLESELNVRLLTRGHRGITLTEEGKRFLECAETITSSINNYLDALYINNNESPTKSTINIYVTHYSAQIAAATQEYVDLLVHSTYIEEPFDKIIARVHASGDSDMFFVDINSDTLENIQQTGEFAFDAVISTTIGVVCRADDALAQKRTLRLADVVNLPVALNANREMLHTIEQLFTNRPLENVCMSVANPRMLLRFVKSRQDGVALFDSFGFCLAKADPGMPTEELTFVPFATEKAVCYAGFLFPKGTRVTPRMLHASNVLRKYLSENQAQYLKEYPVY